MSISCGLSGSVAWIVNWLLPDDWARLMCVSRTLQEETLQALGTNRVEVHVSCSYRGTWRLRLHAMGRWCRHISHFSLLYGSSNSLSDLSTLQPCLGPSLLQLTLHGLSLDKEQCNAHLLVTYLLQNCPLLEQLYLQECTLPHVAVFKRLTSPVVTPAATLTATPPAGTRSQMDQRLQQTGAGSFKGLKVFQCTGAHFATGPESLSDEPLAVSKDDARRSAASKHPSDGISSSPDGTQRRATHAPQTCSPQHQHASRLQTLCLGYGSYMRLDAVHTNWSITSSDVMKLLAGGAEALQVLDLSKRPSVDDTLLLFLAAQGPPKDLRTLDVSFTHVTPKGLLQLLQHCPSLQRLHWAYRCGSEGLNTAFLQQLAVLSPMLEVLDVSLHTDLDNEGLMALAQCRQLRQVTFARSHKITSAGLMQFVTALPHLQLLDIWRCRKISQACLQHLEANFPLQINI